MYRNNINQTNTWAYTGPNLGLCHRYVLQKKKIFNLIQCDTFSFFLLFFCNRVKKNIPLNFFQCRKYADYNRNIDVINCV